MTTVNVHAAKTHFSRLLEAVERGEEVIIARRGKPVAKLVSCEGEVRKVRLGGSAGEVVIHPEFYDEMTEEELEDWYGKDEAEEPLV
ncbi:MAG: hypothetical protein C0506_04850 [Anaerolinea sp.]|nr:hypothetical protein [Anaerolinea sp.]